MTIKDFVLKALDGGWESDIADVAKYFVELGDEEDIHIHRILVAPKAWEAVGKVEGWDGFTRNKYIHCHNELVRNPAYAEDARTEPPGYDYEKCRQHQGRLTTEVRNKMHSMIDALAEGRTLQDFLKDL